MGSGGSDRCFIGGAMQSDEVRPICPKANPAGAKGIVGSRWGDFSSEGMLPSGVTDHLHDLPFARGRFPAFTPDRNWIANFHLIIFVDIDPSFSETNDQRNGAG